MKRRQCLHSDPKFFQDEKPKEGKIRTRCKVCKRFIGYRLVESEKRK